MLNIENKSYAPSMSELCEFTRNNAFDTLKAHMENEYNALIKIEYSGDKVLLGWNVKYKKAGKTLCTVYPREGHFFLLLVVGQKEKPYVEALLPSLSQEFARVYNNTREGMGQRWMVFDIFAEDELLCDILKVVKIRRECK